MIGVWIIRRGARGSVIVKVGEERRNGGQVTSRRLEIVRVGVTGPVGPEHRIDLVS